jgi:hypothetical protein
MYTIFIALHSYLRWVVLLLAIMAVARGVSGWRARRPWTPADDRAGRLLSIAFDVQVLIGLLLYVALSPLTQAAFGDFGGAMRDSVLRFFAVEHIFGMLIAMSLVHIGRAKTRREASSVTRHKAAAIYFGLGLLIAVISIPWPGLPAGRPLFWGR